MAYMNMVQALNSAMDIMLARDPRVVILGEDVGYFGGVFRVTDGLQRKYGEHRVLDTPISEGGIIGAAIGMGVNGLKPVAEIQFADYIYPGFDQVVSELARLRYRTAGEFSAPVTIRTPCGGGIRGGQTHSQSPEAIFTHVSGIKVVMPSNPYDAKGLLISAIEDDDPVVFFEPKRRYWSKGEIADEATPLYQAKVVRAGDAVTVLAYGPAVGVALDAATVAAEEGRELEVIDLRTLSPLDMTTVLDSVRRTGRAVIVHEAQGNLGLGAEVAARIQEQAFYSLEAPVLRVTGYDTPYPPARIEDEWLPNVDRILDAVDRSLAY
jgi:2-oxoisovalerate dehydrogenase E1 component beta subunit